MIWQVCKAAARRALPGAAYSALARAANAPRRRAERRHNLWNAARTADYIEENRGKRIILVCGIHPWGNLGDHAINIAERKWLEARFPGALIAELALREACAVAERIAAMKCPRLVVAVAGGGWLGNLYLNQERPLRELIRAFAGYRIAVFPQTVFFDEREESFRAELAASAAAYNSHPDLHFFIRDRSIAFLRENVMSEGFRNLYSVPDIALFLEASRPGVPRSGVLFCMRPDKEKVLGDSDAQRMIDAAAACGQGVRFTSTVVPARVPSAFRDFAVGEKLAEFQGAALAVTDRLHGMLFAVITGTPCIALDNLTRKVEGVHSLWLGGIPYARFARSAEEAISLMPQMLSLGGQRYSSSQFEAHWQKMAEVIAEGLGD